MNEVVERVVIGADFNGHVGEGNVERRGMWKDRWWWRLRKGWKWMGVRGGGRGEVAGQHRMVICRTTLEIKKRKRVKEEPKRQVRLLCGVQGAVKTGAWTEEGRQGDLVGE